MVDLGNTSTKDRWVCPNDRHLALRAKLKTGWSVKTQSLQSYVPGKDTKLNDAEQQMIKEVIKRAEMLQVSEEERIGRLVHRLESIKKAAMGDGINHCILCGDRFGVLGSSSLMCYDCKKAVCRKCGIETLSAHKETISLCKICSETREMWKKSGAWFFKGLPKYVLPENKSNAERGLTGNQKPQRPGLEKNSWSRASSGHLIGREEEESSSEDELSKRTRQRKEWQNEDSESSFSKISLRRQSSNVTFDTSPANVPVTPTMPLSESGCFGIEEEMTYDTQVYDGAQEYLNTSRENMTEEAWQYSQRFPYSNGGYKRCTAISSLNTAIEKSSY